MGRVHSFPGPWHGSRDGTEELEGRLVCISGRCDGLHNWYAHDLVHERLRLSHRGRWQTDVQPLFGLPAFLRIDDSFWRVRIAVRHAVFESFAAIASSVAEEQTFCTGDS